jgi:hypothetical protein
MRSRDGYKLKIAIHARSIKFAITSAVSLQKRKRHMLNYLHNILREHI